MHVLKEDDEARRLAKINKATRILTEEGEDDDNDDDKAHRKFEKELEEARQQAEEAARRKAKEEARHKAEEMRRKALEEARHKEEASWKAKEERRKAIEEASWKAKEERCKAIEEASQKAEEERRKTALAVAMKEATDQNPCQQGAMSGVPHEIEQSHTTDSSESGLTAESVSAKRTLDQSQEEGRPEKVEGLHLKYLEFFFQSAVKEDCKVEETYESPSKYHVYGDDDDDGLEDQLEKKANRLFEVKKGKKKENHWRGIQLVAKDEKLEVHRSRPMPFVRIVHFVTLSFLTITRQTVRPRQITERSVLVRLHYNLMKSECNFVKKKSCRKTLNRNCWKCKPS
jgi:hypothetical protein